MKYAESPTRGSSRATLRVDAELSGGAVSETPHTREHVARQLLEHGPVTTAEVAERLGVSSAGIRRHLDVMVAAGEARSVAAPSRVPRGRGRPARRYLLTETGRSRFGHSYDDLATAALRQLRELGGDNAVNEFARRRMLTITGRVSAGAERDVAALAEGLATSLTEAGYAASVRELDNGVQICQHHCPVAHVAAEFPELCDAEQAAFAEVLGTHVQRLATIANGDPVCTTHVPIGRQPAGSGTPAQPTVPSTQAPISTNLRKEHA